MDPIDGKFAAFGWQTQVINGNDMGEVVKALERARAVKGQPTCIVSLTHKGQGILNLLTKLGDTNFHGKPVPPKYLDEALAEVDLKSRENEPPGRQEGGRSEAGEINESTSLSPPASGPRPPHCSFSRGGLPTTMMDITTQAGRALGKATRDAFGRALEALGADHPDVVVVDADVGNSTRTEWFGKKYPDRFFNIGIAESNLVGSQAAWRRRARRRLIASFAAFITCNAYDQLADVGGLSPAERQGRRQPRRDLHRRGRRLADGDRGRRPGLCTARLHVLVPADEASARRRRGPCSEHKGPVYLRVGRPEVPVVYPTTRIPPSRSAKPTSSATART